MKMKLPKSVLVIVGAFFFVAALGFIRESIERKQQTAQATEKETDGRDRRVVFFNDFLFD